MAEENKTIEIITQEYEEQIATREKEFLKEKEDLEKKLKEEFEKEKKDLIAQHNKDIADIVRGRKSVEEIQNKDEENDEKSFFDKAVEDTKKKLKGGI